MCILRVIKGASRPLICICASAWIQNRQAVNVCSLYCSRFPKGNVCLVTTIISWCTNAIYFHSYNSIHNFCISLLWFNYCVNVQWVLYCTLVSFGSTQYWQQNVTETDALNWRCPFSLDIPYFYCWKCYILSSNFCSVHMYILCLQ